MTNHLSVTTVQAELCWEDIPANLAQFDQLLSGLRGTTDLVILPEMFSTGFSMNAASLAEDMDGPTLAWLRSQAEQLDAVVMGSFIAEEGGHYFNRLAWVRPDGTCQTYDKRHLFTPSGEHLTYTAGQHRLVVEWKGWRICPLICYDLRFPVWSRNTSNYDLLVYVANWPEKRRHHWNSLLVARAIENQAYVVGVNRVGEDGLGYRYTGDSAIIDQAGEILHASAPGEANVSTVELSLEKLHAYRKSLQFLADKDEFEIFIR